MTHRAQPLRAFCAVTHRPFTAAAHATAVPIVAGVGAVSVGEGSKPR